MEERMALGVYLNSGVINSSVRSTITDITMLDAAVLQPAMQFTADRPKPPNKIKRFCSERKNVYNCLCCAVRLVSS